MAEHSGNPSDPVGAPDPVAARAAAASSVVQLAPRVAARPARSRAAKPAPESGTAASPEIVPPSDLRAAELYLNRELTWLAFNRRVLHEARDPRTPLLERVKFLAIVSSNLDEFFMKRIGGLKQQVGAGLHDLTVDGRTPEQQIDECVAVIRELTPELRDTYAELRERLREQEIRLALWSELTEQQREAARTYYLDNIFPLVTPLAMDPAHPFPFISNLSLNLLITLHHQDDPQPVFARVKVPIGKGVPRYLRVGPGHSFVRLEEVMAHSLDRLFPGMEIDACEIFRVTRNANTEREEEDADDLVSMIEAELRDRKFAPIVRLEVGLGIDPVHRGMLAVELGLDEERDVFETGAPLGLRDLFEIATLELPALHDPVHHPVTNAKLEDQERNVFHIIRDIGPILLQHPYESFGTSVERFVHEASRDPKVLAIKMTLYRTSSGTRIIEDLIAAARNGKQVAVVVEIKARFDEEANIQWANRLEEVGIHVMYGVVGLKTHSKVVLVVRRDYTGIRRYAHIGTGNYHAGTARIYSDLGLLTCDDAIGRDLTELFNYLTTGYKPSRKYHKLLVAPKSLKLALLEKVEREIAASSSAQPGVIRFKMNALEDADIVRALYRASQAGVRVELIVRDTCRLRPGLPGISENITVVSIVGRFLEHARIYYFRNGGEEEFFIGSADLMTRNLESRVEVVTPVEEQALREELRAILETQLADRRSAWEMRPDGSYVQRQPGDGAEIGSQQALIAVAESRLREATRLRKRRPQSIARRSPTERAVI